MASCYAFGPDCYALATYAEIGQTMGISRRRARCLVARAKKKLRHEPDLQLLIDPVPPDINWYGDEDSFGIAQSDPSGEDQ